MKKVTICLIIGFLSLSHTSLIAQVSLPYYSGFDDASEQNGWVQYQTPPLTLTNWGYTPANAFSAPNCLKHDYAPSSGITVVDDWFVSPEFSIPNGGKLDSIRYMFSGFSVPDVGDTIAIYLLNGSQDPALASSKQLLFDFRGSEFMNDGTYRVKTDINLPAFNGASYIAIRYRNSDASSKWITVAFDNVAISDATITGLNESEEIGIDVFPNPSEGSFVVNSIHKIQSVTVQNLAGQRVYSSSELDSNNSTTINLSDMPKGIYIITVSQNDKRITERLVIQ